MPHKKRGVRKHKQRKPPAETSPRGEKTKAEVEGGDAVAASRNLDLMGDKPPYPVEG